ncbi:MAG: hypothetical protein JWO84_610, partial [Parcubacteria group bacterium]|nr:hypothetical protein [Parcubacteria group bacterium]
MSGILTTVPKSLLRLVSDQIQLDGVENYDPDRFYRSRSGLSVAQDFMPAVLWKARSSETKTLGPISLSSYEITESVKDDNLITSAFGGNHTFD